MAQAYAKKQIEIGLPEWFKTLQHCIHILQAEGHSEKLSNILAELSADVGGVPACFDQVLPEQVVTKLAAFEEGSCTAWVPTEVAVDDV